MPPDPLVSVVVPAHAAARYIREALDSVFGRTYPRYEVIVIHDGSPDTGQLETAIADYEGRVVYVKQPNRGPSAARNAGILRAQGEFVAFLDSDDAWLPNYLERQFRHCEDFDLGLRIAFRGAHMTFQREGLACHRLRNESLSACAASMQEARKQVYEKVKETLPLNDAQRAVAEKMMHLWSARIALELGKQSLLRGDHANARAGMQSANAHFRSRKISALLALLNVAPSSTRWLYAAILLQGSRFHKNGDSAAGRIAASAHLSDHSDADLSSPAPPK